MFLVNMIPAKPRLTYSFVGTSRAYLASTGYDLDTYYYYGAKYYLLLLINQHII